MTSPSPEQINATLAKVFGGWKPQREQPCDRCEGCGYVNCGLGNVPRCYVCNGIGYELVDKEPPAYTDSLGLAVELLRDASFKYKFSTKISMGYYGRSLVNMFHADWEENAIGDSLEQAICKALYSCAIQLGLTEGV